MRTRQSTCQCLAMTMVCVRICWNLPCGSGRSFMYILPNFQNPSGTTLPLNRRLEIVRLSNKYGIPIVEDDPYGALRFERGTPTAVGRPGR